MLDADDAPMLELEEAAPEELLSDEVLELTDEKLETDDTLELDDTELAALELTATMLDADDALLAADELMLEKVAELEDASDDVLLERLEFRDDESAEDESELNWELLTLELSDEKTLETLDERLLNAEELESATREATITGSVSSLSDGSVHPGSVMSGLPSLSLSMPSEHCVGLSHVSTVMYSLAEQAALRDKLLPFQLAVTCVSHSPSAYALADLDTTFGNPLSSQMRCAVSSSSCTKPEPGSDSGIGVRFPIPFTKERISCALVNVNCAPTAPDVSTIPGKTGNDPICAWMRNRETIATAAICFLICVIQNVERKVDKRANSTKKGVIVGLTSYIVK